MRARRLQYMDVLSADPAGAEKRRAVRFARDGMDAGGRATQGAVAGCESNHRGGRWPFWLLFGPSQKVTRSPEGRVKALHFKNGTKVKMDSGLRRNDEQAKDEQGKGEQRTDEQVQCEEGQGEQ